jgi:hypothetical protein
MLTEVDAKSGKRAVVTMFSDPSACKQRGHPPAAERNAILAPQGQEVSADSVFVTGEYFEVIC